MSYRAAGFALLATISCPAAAVESPRDILLGAAFSIQDKGLSLARIDGALKAAEAALAKNPRDQDARLQRALAISYRGKLTRSRSDLIMAREEFDALVAANPRNAEAQLALAGWHLGVVIDLGPLLGRSVLGARKATGLQALDRALTLGGDRAMYPALASLAWIQLEPGDIAGSRRLAETAVRARAPTLIDQTMQRQAAALLRLLTTGNGKAAAKEAKLLSPFGRVH